MARRPKVSNKLGIPHPGEGSDGDVQVRQTNLGAKLYGKIGGRWKSVFLSDEDEIIGTSGTRIGMDSSGAFTVDQINLTGKITLTGDSSSQNIIIGTGQTDAGTDNVFLGKDTGASIETGGNQNICIGTNAGNSITTGDINVCVGFHAGQAIDTDQANTLVGYYAGRYIVDSATGGTPSRNTCFGANSGNTITGGHSNVCIGAGAQVSASGAINQIAIGQGITCTGNNDVALGNTSIDTIAGQVSFTTYSDSRIKHSIIDTDIGLNFIKLLRPVKYKKVNPADYPEPLLENKFKDEGEARPADIDSYYDGLVAQEVKAVCDGLGITFSAWDEAKSNGKQRLQYAVFITPLIKAVQELSAQIGIMQTEINNLKEG